MNPCFSPLELSSAAGGGCGPNSFFGRPPKAPCGQSTSKGLRPSADWDWDWATQGSPLGHARATQAPRKGRPWVKLSKCFVCNKSPENGGWGLGNRRNRTSSHPSRAKAARSGDPGDRRTSRGIGKRRTFTTKARRTAKIRRSDHRRGAPRLPGYLRG